VLTRRPHDTSSIITSVTHVTDVRWAVTDGGRVRKRSVEGGFAGMRPWKNPMGERAYLSKGEERGSRDAGQELGGALRTDEPEKKRH